MNLFKEYSEAIKVDSRMTPEDRRQVARYREIIADLRTQGDDQGIMADIRTLYSRIKKIENKYISDEEKKKAAEASTRSSMKRTKAGFEARKQRGGSATEKYNAMTDEDKAREAVVALRNLITLHRSGYGGHRDAINLIKRQVKAATEEIVSTYNLQRPYQIKSQFSLKEKAGHWSNIKVPEKIKEIFEKHELYGGYI